MSLELTLAVGGVLVGIAMRIFAQAFESRHITWAWDFFRSPGDVSPEDREIMVERTHRALSAARLGRLIALWVLIPSALALANLPGVLDWTQGHHYMMKLLPSLTFAVVIPFLVISLTNAVMMKGFHDKTRISSVKVLPNWMTTEDERIPIPVTAGWMIWDALVRGGEVVTKPLKLERPRAHLVKVEGQVVLAVGDQELGALEPVTDNPKRNLTGERNERDMIRAIQRLDETLVREVMRPLNNVVAVALTNLTAEKFLTTARRTGYTRFPCYYDQVTNLIGYLNVHDFLSSPVLPTDIRKLVHGTLFIPEVARVDVALQEMLRSRSQIAICFDEFGGCSGLLSREDIIEEITGEIMDEYDRPELKITEGRGGYSVEGTIDLDDLSDALGIELEKKNCDTLAGYILQRFSRMPRRGEHFVEQDMVFEVIQVENHRIRKVRITPTEQSENSTSNDAR